VLVVPPVTITFNIPAHALANSGVGVPPVTSESNPVHSLIDAFASDPAVTAVTQPVSLSASV
jgi:hypothetical protein